MGGDAYDKGIETRENRVKAGREDLTKKERRKGDEE
jgi:hypothetical protein